MEDKEGLMTDIHDRIIAIAEEKYGKDSKVAQSFRKNKEIAEYGGWIDPYEIRVKRKKKEKKFEYY